VVQKLSLCELGDLPDTLLQD